MPNPSRSRPRTRHKGGSAAFGHAATSLPAAEATAGSGTRDRDAPWHPRATACEPSRPSTAKAQGVRVRRFRPPPGRWRTSRPRSATASHGRRTTSPSPNDRKPSAALRHSREKGPARAVAHGSPSMVGSTRRIPPGGLTSQPVANILAAAAAPLRPSGQPVTHRVQHVADKAAMVLFQTIGIYSGIHDVARRAFICAAGDGFRPMKFPDIHMQARTPFHRYSRGSITLQILDSGPPEPPNRSGAKLSIHQVGNQDPPDS